MSAQTYDPWDDVELPPQDTIDLYKNKPKKDAWDELDFDESFWKSAFRKAAQIPQGIAEATPYGIGASLFQMLALGESDLGVEEFHKLRELAEEEGIPFDEEAYENARNEMLQSIPTISNIGRKVEQETGIPLEAKTKWDKALRLGSMAAKFQPGAITQKAASGVTAPAVSTGLEEIGVPEPISEIAGLVVSGSVGGKVPAADISLSKKKPSGLTERQFENLKEPREVSEKKLGKINQKLETDFKEISDKIIKESPVGETFENLKNDPTFKQESREVLDQAQKVADSLPGTIAGKSIKKEIADVSAKNSKGFIAGEYDKNYSKFIKETIDGFTKEHITRSELVKQYRKNNGDLSEYFEPGSSKAFNRAKRDAILDTNRAIANIIEKSDAELGQIFKDGNQRWTKLMDSEAVDSFINELFSEKVNYKKMHDFFDKNGYDRVFKRALGDKGYKDFELLLKDMLESETPYKMLKVAKQKGFEDLFKTGLSFVLHPKIGIAKASYDVAKNTFKDLMNSMLDNPKISVTWKKGIDDLKKGNFSEAEKAFSEVEKEVKIKDVNSKEISKSQALKKFNERKKKT